MEFNHSVAVIIQLIEESIDCALWRLVPERRHGRAHLLLVDGAVAVVVPFAEQVDQPDAMLAQDLLKLLWNRHTLTVSEPDHRRQRRRVSAYVVEVDALSSQLGGPTAVNLLGAAKVLFRQLRAGALTQHDVQLLVVELARLVCVQSVEDQVCVLLLDIKAERDDCLEELLLVDSTGAVLVPRTEQVDHALR